MNNILKLITISFEKYYYNNRNEYLKIDFIKNFMYDNCDNINPTDFINKKIPIYFVYDIKDNLELKDININDFDTNEIYDNKKQILELVDQDNEIIECIDFSLFSDRKYIIYSNLNNNIVLKNKIYSNDYKLFLFYEDHNFIVKLIYSPNIRKYKLQQIKKTIK